MYVRVANFSFLNCFLRAPASVCLLHAAAPGGEVADVPLVLIGTVVQADGYRSRRASFCQRICRASSLEVGGRGKGTTVEICIIYSEECAVPSLLFSQCRTALLPPQLRLLRYLWPLRSWVGRSINVGGAKGRRIDGDQSFHFRVAAFDLKTGLRVAR